MAKKDNHILDKLAGHQPRDSSSSCFLMDLPGKQSGCRIMLVLMGPSSNDVP